MTTKLTSMAYKIISTFVTRDGRNTGKLGDGFVSRVAETTMPEGGGSNSGENTRGRGRQAKRIKRTEAIAPGDHVPRPKVLHREAKRVKLNRAIVVSGKLAD